MESEPELSWGQDNVIRSISGSRNRAAAKDDEISSRVFTACLCQGFNITVNGQFRLAVDLFHGIILLSLCFGSMEDAPLILDLQY